MIRTSGTSSHFTKEDVREYHQDQAREGGRRVGNGLQLIASGTPTAFLGFVVLVLSSRLTRLEEAPTAQSELPLIRPQRITAEDIIEVSSITAMGAGGISAALGVVNTVLGIQQGIKHLANSVVPSYNFAKAETHMDELGYESEQEGDVEMGGQRGRV
jgi:hypothetical protein